MLELFDLLFFFTLNCNVVSLQKVSLTGIWQLNRQNCRPERFDRLWSGLLKTQKSSSSSLIEGSENSEHSHLPTYLKSERWECKKKKKKEMKVVRTDLRSSVPIHGCGKLVKSISVFHTHIESA